MFVSQLRPRHAALVVVLAAAGCGGGGTATNSSNGQASKDTSSSEKAVPMSEDEYRALVDDSAHVVSRAVSDVRGASTREGLQNRLEKSGAALDEAAVALAAKPAPDVSGNAKAVAALKDLSTAFTAAAGKVESGALCTAPAALAQLTRSNAAGDLRSAAKDLGVSALGPKRQAFPALRLKSGAVLSNKTGASGPGLLVIKNGNAREGVVKLVGDGQRISIYVGRRATARVTQIPDGNFGVYFASGVSWDGKRNTFTRNCGFTKFDRKMKFTSGGGSYMQFTITLNAVSGGNAATRQIDPSDFPKG
jgi:hypothetical protein